MAQPRQRARRPLTFRRAPRRHADSQPPARATSPGERLSRQRPRQTLIHSRGCGYTPGMKTAISIPDDLFQRADELAGRLGKSRSELYREALADYVARRETGAVTSALNEIADEVVADRAGFGDRAARFVLERDEW